MPVEIVVFMAEGASDKCVNADAQSRSAAAPRDAT